MPAPNSQEYRGTIQHIACETMYRCKLSFGGKAKTERWIVADSILSIGSARRKKSADGGGSNALRKTSFLSSEAQWSQRAARQQGADTAEVVAEVPVVDVICGGAGNDEGGATSSDSNGPTSKRKRRDASKDAPTRTGIGRSRPTCGSSRSRSRSTSPRSHSSRSKRVRRRTPASSPIDLFSDDSGGGDHVGNNGVVDDFREEDDDAEYIV